jgi:hypothetical protein
MGYSVGIGYCFDLVSKGGKAIGEKIERPNSKG